VPATVRALVPDWCYAIVAIDFTKLTAIAEMRGAGQAAVRLLPDFVGLVFDGLERCTESGAERTTNK